jgi:hypothetical protein
MVNNITCCASSTALFPLFEMTPSVSVSNCFVHV